jgi:eukaryotic-like serine/threonine-protein kinase
MADRVTTTVGKYQILELVGEGAMGNVYRALDPVLNRSVAIKVMSDAIAREGALRDRFMREAQAAGSLQHPNVVTVYDFGEVEGHLFIAMEFVDGIDLEHIIDERVPMSMDERIGIAIDVLLGLSYAHKHGVVHRDIKPANIRVTEDGHAKIMDFGVAHLDSAKMTATGVMIGTPNYMAPEQVTGQKIGPATDIFSVGALLYELVSHKKAFGADSIHNVLFKVVSEDPPPLALAAPEAPRGLDLVIRRALAKEPADRYQTAQEMANALTTIRAGLDHSRIGTSLSLGATIAAKTAERLAAAPNDYQRTGWTPGRIITATAVVVFGLVGVTWAFALRRQHATEAVLNPPPSAVTTANPSPTVPPAAKESAVPAPRADANENRPAKIDAPPGPERELSIVNVVRGSAMRARARAVDAGVPAAQLDPGDRQLADAERLTGLKRYPEAVAAMNGAMTAWAAVEKAASKTGAPATQSPPARTSTDSAIAKPEPPRPNPASSAPLVIPPAPVTASPQSRTEPDPPSPTTEINALIADYAQGIESRDLARIRALYPAITDEQQRGFQSFFQTVRGLRATLNVGSVTTEGNAASAQVTGAYDYTDGSGKPVHQVLSFRATFRRDANRWRIASVR